MCVCVYTGGRVNRTVAAARKRSEEGGRGVRYRKRGQTATETASVAGEIIVRFFIFIFFILFYERHVCACTI